MNSQIDGIFRETLAEIHRLRRWPESTYRLQLHKGFGFRAAAEVVPYLAELGVTHVYCSPYLKARPGSTHGYDVIDHGQLNPELGTQADFEAFLEALEGAGMSHILDTVPNHAGIGTNDNGWWNDVLERGQASKYAGYFDISWEGSPRPELRGKVLLPVLGEPYGEALDGGKFKFVREGERAWIEYGDRRLPLNASTVKEADYNGCGGDSRSWDRLDALLQEQAYRLTCWKNAPDEINYRRFFDIDDLAALNMQKREVFEDTHELTLGLCAEGHVSGLRIDHPDGLLDPAKYFRDLQVGFVTEVARRRGLAEELTRAFEERVRAFLKEEGQWPLYVLGEKILAVGEGLPRDWALHGTSGYDFLIECNSLFVDSAAEGMFTEFYQRWTGDDVPFEELVYRKKKLILRISLASELQMLAMRLDRIAQMHRRSRDFSLSLLRRALREAIACFPVYRTYVCEEGSCDSDAEQVDKAIAEAWRRNPSMEEAVEGAVFEFLRGTLLGSFGEEGSSELRRAQREFAGRFQQLTAPVTAKGIEDTAFYLYNRFVSLNEVGGEPGRFGIEPRVMHEFLSHRAASWPRAMNALSTHDTKRSEDVRARLNVLGELPGEWMAAVERWGGLAEKYRSGVGPMRNDEYLVYQTLIGAWPLEPCLAEEREAFFARVQAYLQKALREGKEQSSWSLPNVAYEKAVSDFVTGLVHDREFLGDFGPLLARVSRLGLMNSLAQTLLRLTSPGVPDTYQGMELWDFSLVDPDNRRPVDFARRRTLLASEDRSLETGGAKLAVTKAALRLRKERPGLFIEGTYEPALATGEKAKHVFAFFRRRGGEVALTVIPRLVVGIEAGWGQTVLPLDRGTWRNVLTGALLDSPGSLAMSEILGEFPVALLVRQMS